MRDQLRIRESARPVEHRLRARDKRMAVIGQQMFAIEIGEKDHSVGIKGGCHALLGTRIDIGGKRGDQPRSHKRRRKLQRGGARLRGI
jgi:hypothetical protein